MDAQFPYEIANTASGPVRVVYASKEDVADAPSKIWEIQSEKKASGEYALAAGWHDFGAMVNPGSYSTGNTQTDFTLQNDTVPVDSEVTAVARSVAFNVAELTAEALSIIEESPTVETIAAGAAASGHGAGKALPMGTYDEATKYRVAFIGRRRKSAGLVHETAGDAGRGRLFAVCLFHAAISGDTKTATFDRGAFSSMDVTFNAYPDPDEPAGADQARWIDEDAQTLP